MRQRSIWFVTLLFALPATSHATKYAGEFMAIGGGARALGMGGAFAAVAGDVSTVYWNPAGISGMERQALAMHSERFGDLVNFNFGAYAQPTTFFAPDREAAFGFALIHVGIDDIPITRHLGYIDLNGNGEFDSGDMLEDGEIPYESDNSFALLNSVALETSYGRIGGTLKIIYQDAIAGESSAGIGLDLGWLKRDAFFDNLSLGAKLQDATGTYISWSTGTNEFITPMLKMGAAYEIISEGFNGSLLVAGDADIYFENRQGASQFWVETFSTDLHFGLELQFQEKVMVRGGLDTRNPTVGAGLRIGMLGFDYAWHHVRAEADEEDSPFDDTHRVSAMVTF